MREETGTGYSKCQRGILKWESPDAEIPLRDEYSGSTRTAEICAKRLQLGSH